MGYSVLWKQAICLANKKLQASQLYKDTASQNPAVSQNKFEWNRF